MVEPVTFKVPAMEVVAKVEIPETVKAVVEAFCREVLPETVRILDIVVEPVMPRVLEAEVQVKLPLPPVVVAAE